MFQRSPSSSTTTVFMNTLARGGLGANIFQLCEVPVTLEPAAEQGARGAAPVGEDVVVGGEAEADGERVGEGEGRASWRLTGP
jgi:hypothetical protein